MTLLVDRRKDNYDDLLMLARDARVSRARVNRWTTGLVVGAMAAMGVYVATVSKEVDQLRETAKAAGEQRDTVQTELANLKDERNALAAQLDAVSRFEEMYAQIAPALILGDRFKDIALRVPGGSGTGGTLPAPQFSLSNLVWIVDGSRRFPMTSGDILWVPEGEFWVRMEKPASGKKPDTVSIHRGKKPVESSVGVRRHVFAADPLVADNSYEIRTGDAVSRGVANCVKLTYHEDSSRDGFRTVEFVDIEVLFENNTDCANR